MDFFFVEPQDVRGDTLTLRGEEYKHLSRVLRKNVGERIMVTDGEGTVYEVEIRSLGRAGAECGIVGTRPGFNEPRVELTLAVSLLKNPARFEFVVEKGTELGVRAVVPLRCERTIPKAGKQTRLGSIALAAMKQSGRAFRPRVYLTTPFEVLIKNSDSYDVRLIPHERTEQSQFIGSVMRHYESARKVLVVVGPEGGFTEEELRLASAHGFVPISLGPRRLRSETAALSAASWVVGGW